MDANKPVKISPGARAALSYHMRQWSGWNQATLVLDTVDTDGTEVGTASCLHDPHYRIALNPEYLLLNPNRVLNTVSPFRLRQEAVLTGALLHECAHARHSHWQPGRYGNPAQARHGGEVVTNDDGSPAYQLSGEPVKPLTLEFAKVIEEARVEGIMAVEAANIGAKGLAWTMRCSALKVLPLTEVNVDPDQAVLDVVTSWVMRAGRQIATSHHVTAAGGIYPMPMWVSEFNNLLLTVISKHIIANKMDGEDLMPFEEPSAEPELTDVMTSLYEAVTAGETADTGTYMVDVSKKILDLLFPPSDDEDQRENLSIQGGCMEDQAEEDSEPDESDEQAEDGAESPEAGDEPGDGDPAGDGDDEADPEDTGGESDEDGQDGEGNTEPEDEGEGDDPGEGDTGNDDDGDGKPDDGDKPDEGGATPEQEAAQAELQEELSKVEQTANQQSTREQREETKNPSEFMAGESQSEPDKDSDPADGASGGRGEGQRNIHYRQPKREEREVKKGAVEFLRNLIDPSEAGKLQITDSPSALIDGGALAAWKAGGQKTDPRFFRRIKRTDTPAAPVKIAILVDVSASMDVLQKPSALLSWALASGCLDLRNFAGRGVQVESTLIHWGSSARVIQRNGDSMPGIHEGDCMESTSAMADALDLVDQQLPGFFETSDKPENRLLVQFTDWELAGWNLADVEVRIDKAITSGVNMMSVVPQTYSHWRTRLPEITQKIARPLGRNALLRYDPRRPQEVWQAATELLSGAPSNYGF